jgi:alpha-galactosidase
LRRNLLLDRSAGAVVFFLLTAVAPTRAAPSGEVWLDGLDLRLVRQGWGSPGASRSVDGNALSIGGTGFARGVGTHARGAIEVDLAGGASRFEASVGVDDEVFWGLGSVVFRVEVDGKTVFQSGVMRRGMSAVPVSVGLAGARRLRLVVENAGNGIDFDHADWADARVVLAPGAGPVALVPPAPVGAPEVGPPPPVQPRLVGPAIAAVRPGADFLFLIPATGAAPITYGATGLPPGLTLDPARGIISGRIAAAGSYRVSLSATNARGTAQRWLEIVVGDHLALTPPMGWSSWYAGGFAVDEGLVRRVGDALVRTGLARHGYVYVNIDDGWQGPRGGPWNAIQPDPKFHDMSALTAALHARGLRAGIYSTPNDLAYSGRTGSKGHEADDARQFAAWGFDFLKYDWFPVSQASATTMHQALRATGRDVVLSLSNTMPPTIFGWTKDESETCRTTWDITDTWASLAFTGFQQGWYTRWAGPGHWNDPDNLMVGRLGLTTSDLHWSNLTPDEQRLQVSLWSLLAAPLILGGDPDALDDWTIGLLSNDEVIAVDQDRLGAEGERVAWQGFLGLREVWRKKLFDGTVAVGLFNRTGAAQTITAEWSAIGVAGPQPVRDLWAQKDLGVFTDRFTATVAPHGAVLVKIGR